VQRTGELTELDPATFCEARHCSPPLSLVNMNY
jgi:hypothetical protein